MDKLNPNMRRLKRVHNGSGLVYTLETGIERAKDNLLCNYCANKKEVEGKFAACDVYARLMQMEEHRNVTAMIRTCATYQPIITFRPPLKGFDGRFNTFRVGQAWFNRLMPGVIIGLMNAETDEVFAKARVIEVLQGPFDEMADKHAYLNHMLIGSDPDEAGKKMTEIIRKAYGKLVASQPNLQASVIYLECISA